MITAIDKNTALVVIDLQKGIVGGDTAHPIKDILTKAADLIDAFHEERLPVFLVKVDPAAASGKKIRKDVEPYDLSKIPPEAWEFVDEIKSVPSDIIITKPGWNAFFGTSLDEELKQRNITGIVFCGVAASVGVEGTARAASELGYNISIAVDAVTDRTIEAYQHSINKIFPRIAETGTTSDIIVKLADRT